MHDVRLAGGNQQENVHVLDLWESRRPNVRPMRNTLQQLLTGAT